jgi:hypothetical protein
MIKGIFRSLFGLQTEPESAPAPVARPVPPRLPASSAQPAITGEPAETHPVDAPLTEVLAADAPQEPDNAPPPPEREPVAAWKPPHQPAWAPVRKPDAVATPVHDLGTAETPVHDPEAAETPMHDPEAAETLVHDPAPATEPNTDEVSFTDDVAAERAAPEAEAGETSIVDPAISEKPGAATQREIVSEPAAPPLPAPTSQAQDIRKLLMQFETLGSTPEFGLLRERLGAEPDGLLGFSTIYTGALITLLKSKFAGLDDPKNLGTRQAWGRYYIVEQRFQFSWRTNIKVGEMSEPDVLAHEMARLKTLRARLIEDLARGRRLFVVTGPGSDADIAKIRVAMRSYGDNALLHVVEADASRPAGQVQRHAGGWLRGTLSHYGERNGRWDIALDDWAAVCSAAHAMWKAAKPA